VSRARTKRDGWALLTILLACAIFMIMMANVAPDAAFEARRGHEQDLMFRGKDYMRAIGLYYRKFKKYPTRLEDLENTNQIRFLRRRWPDPMTKSDEWRLLHVNAAGLVVDSAMATTGSTTQPGQAGQQQQPNIGLTPSASSSSSTSSLLSPSTGSATSIGTSIASTTGGTTMGFSGQPTVVGAFLAGVASKSEKPSIMTYNTRQKYNEWEFVYDPRKDPTMTQQGVAGQAARPGQTPTGPGGLPGATTPGFGTTPGSSTPGGLNPPGSGTIGVPVTPIKP
jgi:hypothetical protein